MSSSDPPRLATALLRRFAADNEPLIGDLLERYSVKQSRLWFWQQVIAALAVRMFHHADQQHPLGIAGPSEPVSEEPPPGTQLPRHINLSASPIPGIGGLGLVALGVIVAMARPTAWWIFVPAIVGGIALGLTMVLVRRHVMLSGAPGTRRTLLSDTDAAGRPNETR